MLRSGVYADSVKLMQVSRDIAGRDGVTAVIVAMATPLNLELAINMGLAPDDDASPEQLLIGIRALTDRRNASPGGYLEPVLIGALIGSIGLSLGGLTGYAINPARDFGPRVAHAVLPIPGKGGSDWGYAWVPVVGPVVGGAIAALLAKAVILPP